MNATYTGYVEESPRSFGVLSVSGIGYLICSAPTAMILSFGLSWQWWSVRLYMGSNRDIPCRVLCCCQSGRAYVRLSKRRGPVLLGRETYS